MKTKRKRTHSAEVLVDYCRAYAREKGVLTKELLSNSRRKVRFTRFSMQQAAVEEIAESVVPMRDKGKIKRILFFGDGNWRSAKGCAPAPRKKIVRACMQRAVVVIIPEAYSSKKCVGCQQYHSAGEDYRTRVCETPRCPLHLNTDSYTYDRDDNGAAELGVRGVSVMLRVATFGYWNDQT